MNSQCVGVAIEGMDIWYMGLMCLTGGGRSYFSRESTVRVLVILYEIKSIHLSNKIFEKLNKGEPCRGTDLNRNFPVGHLTRGGGSNSCSFR